MILLQKIIIDLGLKIRITFVNNNIVCFTSVMCSSLYYNNFKTLRFYNWHFLYLLLCLFPWSCIVYYHNYPRKIWILNNGETSHRETLFSMRDDVTTSNKHYLPATMRKVWITLSVRLIGNTLRWREEKLEVWGSLLSIFLSFKFVKSMSKRFESSVSFLTSSILVG